MAETRARFLANTIGATSASNDFTLPDGVGSENQVLSSNGAGGTTWANTLSAPTISSVTGSLNEYEDGVSEDGGVLTINGTDFGNDASVLSVQISGTTGFSTVAETSTISISTPGTQLTATFTGAETNYNHSSFAAGSTIYVKVTKSGLQTSTYATLATAMTGDPAFSTTSTTASTHTGTLAATSLGSYGGQVAGGGDDFNTKLLLNFDRGGGTDIEDSSNTGGDGHKLTASGNAAIKASPFGDGKSAMFFDGSDDILSLADHADFDFSGTWTIEFWINASTITTYDGILTFDGSSSADVSIGFGSSSVLHFYSSAGSATSQGNWGTLSAGIWYHIVAVHDGTNLKCYKDGQLVTSTVYNGTWSTASGGLKIGRFYNASDEKYFDGYLDEIRIVNGSAVYASDFTPRTSRLDSSAEASTTKLLISGGKTSAQVTSDSSINTTASTSNDYGYQIGPGTLSVTGAVHSTGHGGIAPAMTWPASLKKTGSAGMYFDGTNDEVDISASTELSRGSSDPFTFECWFYATGSGSQTLFETRDSDYSPQSFYINFQTTNYVFVRTNSSGGLHLNSGGSGAIGNGRFYPNLNTWYHIAVCRGATGGGSGTGTVMRVYVNGRYITKATDANLATVGAHDWGLGHSNGTDDFSGYIDQVRWSNTVRYFHETLGSGDWPDSAMPQPTKIYGAYRSQDVGTIQLNATAGTGGGALDYAELSGGTALSTYGLSLSSSGAITGTLTGINENSNSGGVIRIRARANADDNRVTTLGGSSFTGITQNDDKAPVLFNARRYVGNGAKRDITGFGFQPDLVWIKNRDLGQYHILSDSVRGATKSIFSNINNAEETHAQRVLSFINDGVTIGTKNDNNETDDGIIAWAWKAGGAPSGNGKKIVDGTESNLTSGTDYSGVTNVKQSVNSSGGFSITQYTGNSSTAWIKHGLGASKPDFYIVKALGQAYDWGVWHSGFSTHASDFLNLHDNGEVGTNTGMWGNTGPTTDGKINFGNSATSNGGTNYIMYAWKAVSGVSAFGTYTGNHTTYPHVNCGDSSASFYPRCVIIKRYDGSGGNDWLIYDSFRSGATSGSDSLLPLFKLNEPDAETTGANDIIYSTSGGVKGFKINSTSGHSNTDGGNFIFMAFA